MRKIDEIGIVREESFASLDLLRNESSCSPVEYIYKKP